MKTGKSQKKKKKKNIGTRATTKTQPRNGREKNAASVTIYVQRRVHMPLGYLDYERNQEIGDLGRRILSRCQPDDSRQ